MPQKWEEHWNSVPVVDDAGNAIADPETAKQVRYSKVYSIGNMTLLNSRLNTSLRNYIFSRKIEGEGRKKGIRQYSELRITKADIIDRYDRGEIIWNEASITHAEVLDYFTHLASQDSVSSSFQNMAVNAVQIYMKVVHNQKMPAHCFKRARGSRHPWAN